MTLITCLDPNATALSEQLLNTIDQDLQKPLGKVDEIVKVFEDYQIPYDSWDESQRTRFEEQVQKRETTVYLLNGARQKNGGSDPRVVRFSSVVALRVLHPDGKRELFEFKPDRKTKELKIKMEAGKPVPGVSEKLLGTEDFITAAIRGVKEELSHTVDRNRIQKDESSTDTLLYKPDDRGFFVGLLVRKYILQLKAEDKVMERYVEEGKHSTNHFLWCKL